MNMWQIRQRTENFKDRLLKKTHRRDVINSWSFYHFFVWKYFSKRGWRNTGWKGTQNKIFYDSKAIIINLYGRTQIVQSEGNDWRGTVLAVVEIVHSFIGEGRVKRVSGTQPKSERRREKVSGKMLMKRKGHKLKRRNNGGGNRR